MLVSTVSRALVYCKWHVETCFEQSLISRDYLFSILKKLPIILKEWTRSFIQTKKFSLWIM